jgi:hypothetical protein
MRGLEVLQDKLIGVFETVGDITLVVCRAGMRSFTPPFYIEESRLPWPHWLST